MADLGSIGKDRGADRGRGRTLLVGGYRAQLNGTTHTDAFGKSTALATASATSVVGASISIR